MDQRTAALLVRPIPETRDALLAESLRHAALVARLLDDIADELTARLRRDLDRPQYARLRQMLELLRREISSVVLQTAAQRLGLAFPEAGG